MAREMVPSLQLVKQGYANITHSSCLVCSGGADQDYKLSFPSNLVLDRCHAKKTCKVDFASRYLPATATRAQLNKGSTDEINASGAGFHRFVWGGRISRLVSAPGTIVEPRT